MVAADGLFHTSDILLYFGVRKAMASNNESFLYLLTLCEIYSEDAS